MAIMFMVCFLGLFWILKAQIGHYIGPEMVITIHLSNILKRTSQS